MCIVAVCVCAGDHPIAGDRLKRYLAIGASLANARAHKVRGPWLILCMCMQAGGGSGGGVERFCCLCITDAGVVDEPLQRKPCHNKVLLCCAVLRDLLHPCAGHVG